MADDEQDIFESGGAAPESAPASTDAAVVSGLISDLQRTGGRDQVARTPSPIPAEPAQQPQPGADGPEDRSTAGLLKALLDERQNRQTIAQERDELKRWREDQERQRKAAETPFDQRLFEKPQEAISGILDERMTPIQNQLHTLAMDFDFKIAKMNHGAETFDAAFKDWYSLVGNPQAPNPALYFHVVNSPNPGDTLVDWHKSATFMRDVGNDPTAYRARIEAEILAAHGLGPGTPPPRERMELEQPRTPNGQFTARHEVRLPTATSRMGRAGSGTPPAAEDGSEEAIFDAGRTPRSRR